MKKLLLALTFLLCAAIPSEPMWQWSDIELEIEISKAMENENQDIAADLFEESLFRTRKDKGLYNLRDIDLTFLLRSWSEEKKDFEEAIKWREYASWLVRRNTESSLELYKRLVTSNLYDPEDQSCFEREELRHKRGDTACGEERFYRADSFIKAIELQEIVITMSVDKATELKNLYEIAEATVDAVYGVDGNEIVYNYRDYNLDGFIDGSEVEILENISIREKYQWRRYLRIQRDTMRKLEELNERIADQ